ncbi:ATP-grasp domain-containing protein [Paenibacillus nicotianae]|uniref:ATP-grasp domain-containing protein n=1 Tax=Paenibacillus nicotianae TaxID=1526551 RepID=A0ABW4USR5_9BACL
MSNFILFIESNTTGTGMLALSKTEAWGYTPILYTNNPDRYIGLAETGYTVHRCDTNNLLTLRETIEQTVDHKQICGITTTSEFYLEQVSELAAYYKLPGNSILAVQQARNKAATRRALHLVGINQPLYYIVENIEQLQSVVEEIGLPCIVKPVDDSGSNDVLLCDTFAIVEKQAKKIWNVTTNIRGQQKSSQILVEQYMQGPEYSVESLTWQGKTNILGITQKSLTGLPFFVESGHVFPAQLLPEQYEHIQQTVLRALHAIDFQSGAAHTEVKLTSTGCAIIEINGRLAGGMIPELIRLSTGVDLLEQQMYCALDGPKIKIIKPHSVAEIRFIMADRAGRVKQIDGVEQAKQLEGIHQVQINTKLDQYVQSPENAYHRLGYVIGYGDTAEQVSTFLDNALQIIRITIDEKVQEEVF